MILFLKDKSLKPSLKDQLLSKVTNKAESLPNCTKGEDAVGIFLLHTFATHQERFIQL
jgi:hypothetical protein